MVERKKILLSRRDPKTGVVSQFDKQGNVIGKVNQRTGKREFFSSSGKARSKPLASGKQVKFDPRQKQTLAKTPTSRPVSQNPQLQITQGL